MYWQSCEHEENGKEFLTKKIFFKSNFSGILSAVEF